MFFLGKVFQYGYMQFDAFLKRLEIWHANTCLFLGPTLNIGSIGRGSNEQGWEEVGLYGCVGTGWAKFKPNLLYTWDYFHLSIIVLIMTILNSL